MDATKRERRYNKRVLFSKRDRLVAVLILPGIRKQSITADILNLSETGLGLSLRREESCGIIKGRHLNLKKIGGGAAFEEISNTQMEIKWVLDDHFLDHFAFGCEFSQLPEAVREKLEEYVDSVYRQYAANL